jgi:hypothetical protein
MILFLDVDGVLHSAVNYDSDRLLCKLSLLEDVLRSRRQVDVVISSTWRETRTLSELQALFSPDISHRVVGVTPQWRDVQDAATFGTYVRQAEIEAWLRTHNRAWERWLAVDDQKHLFKPFCQNLFVTNGTTGLTEFDCEALVQRISSAS